MSKFKVGDKVYLKAGGEKIEGVILGYDLDDCDYLFESLKESIWLTSEPAYCELYNVDEKCIKKGSFYIYAEEEHLELIEPKKFTKSDLKDGMVVRSRKKYRGEDLYLVTGDKFIAKKGFIRKDNYSHNLLVGPSCDFDIVEIFNSEFYSLEEVFEKENLKSIWKREEYKEEEINLQKAFELLGKGEEVIVCGKGIYCETVVKIIGSKYYFKNGNGEWKEAVDHGRITTDSKFKIRAKL